MAPRSKTEANARFAKSRIAKAKAKAKVRDTFDVGESVAALVFSHVKSTRDRLALACVSRVWRKVAGSYGSWGTCDLVIDSELGKKITDDRFDNLVRYCSRVKHLEVRDAHGLKFEEGLGSFPASRFASLESLNLTGCSRLTGYDIFECIRNIGLLDRPKEGRLRCLCIAGCDVDINDLPALRECLSIDQKANFPGFKALPEKQIGSFDLWECGNCEEVVQTCDASKCVTCDETFCDECAGQIGYNFCTFCEAFACDDEGGNGEYCERCDRGACEECVSAGKLDFSVCDNCEVSLCSDCLETPACTDNCFMTRDKCGGIWCDECFFNDGSRQCSGKGGCGGVTCHSCIETNKTLYIYCGYCGEYWCSDCDHEVVRKCGPYYCTGCETSSCLVCNPTRKVINVETFHFKEGCVPEYEDCCTDCLINWRLLDELKEFIYS